MQTVNVQALVENLETMAGKARFASLVYTAKESGEVARHTVILGAKYGNVLQESKLALSLVDLVPIAAQLQIPLPVVTLAHKELTDSIQASIDAHAIGEQNPSFTKAGLYRPIGATGIQVALNDGTLELKALSHAKVVIQAGVFKPVKSAPKTIAKNHLRRLLPLSKFRTFALDAGCVMRAKLNGETIDFSTE